MRGDAWWRGDCLPRGMRLETALGWWLACTVHPHAAWRRLRPAGRALLVGTYFGAGYLGGLLALAAG
jgi:hypothetical protein